uniref:Lipid scramblase CLPTM1L n=1 Tax=Acrobeloides nanus TaxID=290746 RepID=A0A914EDK8_9BILA
MGVKLNITSITVVLFSIYIGNSLYTIYKIFHPALCQENDPRADCIYPELNRDENGKFPPVQLRIYSSLKSNPHPIGQEIYRVSSLDIDQEIEESIQIEIPRQTRNNGSLFIHAILLPKSYDSVDPFAASWYLVQTTRITTFHIPQAEAFKLMGDSPEDKTSQKKPPTKPTTDKPVTHFRSILPLSIVADPLKFDARQVPAEVNHLLRVYTNKGKRYYYPIFHIDEMNYRIKDLIQVKSDTKTMDLKILYRPISIGKMRLLVTTQLSLEQFREFGFTEKDFDEIKGIFTDTNFYFLALTVFVAAVHLLLDILSFKNDISFWRGRKTMVGLSTKTLMWRCISQTIIFFYLMDESTSLLVLIPAGFGTLVEYWKLTKALKVTFVFEKGIPKIKLGALTEAEVETDNFDSQAMKYLSLLMIPICIGGAIYSLLYTPHKSWYSWVIQCLANGVYAFGFLFMLPQLFVNYKLKSLFVNYKLKSVAHLPWRAFMYKAFNTFIDDMFAFIITMPTAHRVACFRDDVVFLIYLYQRYLYPVDRTRVNEYGEAFDEVPNAKPKGAQKSVESKKNE